MAARPAWSTLIADLGAKRCSMKAATPRLALKNSGERPDVKRFIGLTIAGLMLVAGLLAITGIPSIAGGSGAS